MDKLIDISGFLGMLLLALTLFWVGKYCISKNQTRRGLIFILFGILLIIIFAKEFLWPSNPL